MNELHIPLIHRRDPEEEERGDLIYIKANMIMSGISICILLFFMVIYGHMIKSVSDNMPGVKSNLEYFADEFRNHHDIFVHDFQMLEECDTVGQDMIAVCNTAINVCTHWCPTNN